MARALFFPPANRTAQWFADAHPGVVMPGIDRLVLHTTEGDGWPGYDGGAKAPGWTARPLRVGGRWQLAWRQHFPANMSDRALVHVLGQPPTNTAQVAQVELVGTCVRGGPGVYWPAAPDDLLAELAVFVRWLHLEWGLPLVAAPLWLPYPASAGASRARMTIAQWQAFSGVCAHEHVPENDHGDAGDLDVARVLQLAQPAPPEEDDMPTAREVADTLLDTPLPDGTRGSDGKALTFRWALTRAYHAAMATKTEVDGLVPDAPTAAPVQPGR